MKKYDHRNSNEAQTIYIKTKHLDTLK
ncbi:hypothetical protein BN1200_190047 [Klebsiella variicola]|nr:hypothetical protein BN1200_190047 [Klebsiella variicola]